MTIGLQYMSAIFELIQVQASKILQFAFITFIHSFISFNVRCQMFSVKCSIADIRFMNIQMTKQAYMVLGLLHEKHWLKNFRVGDHGAK